MITVSERNLNDSKHKMRKQGLIPGIVYSKQKNVPITITQRELEKARSAHEPVMTTSMGDMVVLQEMQRDPVSGKVLHVSFQHIIKGQKFHATVPVHFVHPDVNFSNKGQILKTLSSTVEVKGTAETMVDHISIDVSNLEVHDVVRVKDLPKISGLDYLDDEDMQLAVLDYIHVEAEPDTTQAPVAEVEKETKDKETKE